MAGKCSLGSSQGQLRPIEVEDVEAVQDVIESDAAYVERVTGLPPGRLTRRACS